MTSLGYIRVKLMEKITSEILAESILNLEQYNSPIEDMVVTIVDNYCGELDAYLDVINKYLIKYVNKGKEVPTQRLEEFLLNLSTLLYFSNSSLEHVGLKADSAKIVEKFVYNKVRDKAQGTVQDKNSYAELSSNKEKITTQVYERSYKMIKLKIESGYELLSSIKKVISSRITEVGITRTGRQRADAND